MTVAPKTVGLFYASSVQKTFDEQNSALQIPLSYLGYPEVKPTKNCSTSLANGLKTQVDCQVSIRLTRQLSEGTVDNKTLLEHAKKIQDRLKANGWQGEYSDNAETTSLVRLITSLTSGIDYQPDATYIKKMNGVDCMFQTVTAYSKPDPAAMSSQLTCYRTVNVFGQPSWQ